MGDIELKKLEQSPFHDRPDWMVLGQSAPKRKVDFRALNDKQKRVVRVMYDARGGQSVFSLKDLAKIFEPEVGSFRADSWARNSLRLLVVGNWVRRVGKGKYELTEQGIAGVRSW